MYEANCNRAGEEPGTEGARLSWRNNGGIYDDYAEDYDENGNELKCCEFCNEKKSVEEVETYLTFKEGVAHTIGNAKAVHVCEDCAREMVSNATFEEILEWGKEDECDVKINFVIAQAFSPSAINEILKRELKASVAVLGESVFRGSLKGNEDCFVEWKINKEM